MVKIQKIRLAIVGLGNCACSLVQGITFYKDAKEGEIIPGLLNPRVGPYGPGDIEVVCAFDIDKRKVGKDVSEAIFAKPNNTKIFCSNVPKTGTTVLKGNTLDGIAQHMKEYPEDNRFSESQEPMSDVISALKKSKADILVSYLPVGSEQATEFYVKACLEAGVSFINAIPVFICSRKEYQDEFKKRGLVCAGDDIKSQVGATITHRVLVNLMENRGVKIKRTYQLNTGGNTDFLNMLDRKRLKSKKVSKTMAVTSQMRKIEEENVHVGPSDYIPWLKDNKVCFIRIEGELFGGVPMDMELRLSVEDSPNSAGIMIDVIRLAKLALDNKKSGYLEEVSAYAFKHPYIQYTDSETFTRLKAYMDNLAKNQH